MLKEVEYPWHLTMGIKPLARDYPLPQNLRIFGSDYETYKGSPLCVQIAGPDDEYYFSWVDKDTAFDEFWSWVYPRCRQGGVNLCYFHNLNFDMRVMFSLWHLSMYEQHNDIKLEIPWRGRRLAISALYGKVNKADIKLDKVRLQILDSKAFTQASLERSLKMFGVGVNKLKQPEGLGSIRYDELPKEDPRRVEFEEYSKVDAVGERALGLKIMEFHNTYKVSPSLSLPSYASKVFRRHFIAVGESIPFPPLEVVKAAEKSYHGGKNGFYLEAPQTVEDLYEVDINSAYPYALSQLPEVSKGEYIKVNTLREDLVGVYCISGRVEAPKYPLVFDHAFRRIPNRSNFQDLWHTCYEVLRMRDSAQAQVKIDRLWGYCWKPRPGGCNPYARFVEHFYGKKEASDKKDPYYHFYKLVLNALYGKLVSTIEVNSSQSEDEMRKLRELGVDLPKYLRIDERYDKVLKKHVSLARSWRAGSMYNPVHASLITGHARAYLYDLETQLEALHSATDSVKTRNLIEPQKGLGGLKVECHGRCYLFRNKLYLHFSHNDRFCGHTNPPFKYPSRMLDGKPHPRAGEPLVDYDGQHLCKVALHGFKGPLWVLFDNRHDLIRTGKLTYTYKHVVGLREGMRQGMTPCDFIDIIETLKLYEPYVPVDLIKFIVSMGGFSLQKETSLRGELKWLRESGVRGLVNNVSGKTVDHMREACSEEGFLEPDTTHVDFLNLVVDSISSGSKVFPRGGTMTDYETLYPQPED